MIMPTRRSASGLRIALVAGAALLATSALAQPDDRADMSQIGAPSAADHAATDALAPDQLHAGPASTSVGPQISTAPADSSPPAQVSRAGDTESPVQLSRGPRNAEATEPLSSPRDGRTSAVARVEGEDRCDPQDARAASAACVRVIEARSAEFARPQPAPLSPEQRLLMDGRNRTGGDMAAARRLANNAADPNSPDDQAIASVALQGQAPPAPVEPEPAPVPAEAQAIINALSQITPNP